ncbi:MAG: nucleotide exchange factor GrpE [Candidatus Dormibacteria bacterium]
MTDSSVDRSPEPGPEAESGQIGELEAELARLNASYLRLSADFENFRRRKNQESLELTRYGSAALLEAILPALDNLARAVAHIPEDASDAVAEGLRLTMRQLQEALASQGVNRIPAAGQRFDPRLHDAVMSVTDSDQEPGTVVAELVPGYVIHDRVVRPAQVSVAATPKGPGPPRPGARPRPPRARPQNGLEEPAE